MKVIRLLKWSFFSLLLIVAALAFLLATESGFRLLIRAGESLAGPAFSVGRVQGRFVNSWRLEKVQIHVDGVIDVALEELHCSWQPGALVDKNLLIDRIRMRGLVLRLPDSGDETPENSPIVLPDMHFPFSLQVKDLQVHDSEMYFSDSAEPFVVNELALKASGHDDQLTIDRLKLDTPDYGGDLQGRIQFSDRWPLAAGGKWRVTDPGIGDLSGSVDVDGDLTTLSVSVEIKTPVVARVQGQLTDILNDLHWQATGATEHFQLRDIQVDQPIDGTLTVVKASGTLETYGGTLTADINYQDYPQVDVRAEVQGDYNGLTINVLRLILDEARLDSHGEIGWGDGFSWRAELEAEQVDPARFIANWPGKIDGLLQSHGFYG